MKELALDSVQELNEGESSEALAAEAPASEAREGQGGD